MLQASAALEQLQGALAMPCLHPATQHSLPEPQLGSKGLPELQLGGKGLPELQLGSTGRPEAGGLVGAAPKGWREGRLSSGAPSCWREVEYGIGRMGCGARKEDDASFPSRKGQLPLRRGRSSCPETMGKERK